MSSIKNTTQYFIDRNIGSLFSFLGNIDIFYYKVFGKYRQEEFFLRSKQKGF